MLHRWSEEGPSPSLCQRSASSQYCKFLQELLVTLCNCLIDSRAAFGVHTSHKKSLASVSNPQGSGQLPASSAACLLCWIWLPDLALLGRARSYQLPLDSLLSAGSPRVYILWKGGNDNAGIGDLLFQLSMHRLARRMLLGLLGFSAWTRFCCEASSLCTSGDNCGRARVLGRSLQDSYSSNTASIRLTTYTVPDAVLYYLPSQGPGQKKVNVTRPWAHA